MTATKRLSECPTHKAGWRLTVNGQEMPANTEWKATSRFGSVETAVVLDGEGNPVFDRPAYSEAANVNIIAFGRDASGAVRVAIIRQPRPHADDPEQPGVDGHRPIVFGQVPMGFMEKLTGEHFETSAAAACRETGEETGASVVLRCVQPAYPWHNPNPTFVKTWSELWFVEIDLQRVEALRSTRSEPIYTAEYVTVPELLRRVREGKDHQGAVYRMCTANSLWFIFFATFPDLWTA